MLLLVFWTVILISFTKLFEILYKFASLSGCKINLSNKSEAIHIGALKGSTFYPFSSEAWPGKQICLDILA